MAGPIDELKKKKLQTTLKKVRGNRTLASEKLGVSVRTVRNWVKKFDLDVEFPPVRGKPSSR